MASFGLHLDIMLRITIIAIGKLKEPLYEEQIGDYLRRLKLYAKIDMLELSSESFTTADQQIKARRKEGERIIASAEKLQDAQIIVLDEHGPTLSSEEFAHELDLINRHIVFIVGGALGLSDDVKERFSRRLALSSMTFPHELARLVLVEQIYRAATILNKKQYHY